jgi:hypothetical protein
MNAALLVIALVADVVVLAVVSALTQSQRLPVEAG